MTDLARIMKAAAAGDEPGVRACLAADPGLATAATTLGSKAVHAAHFAGHFAIVDQLLKSGVELDAGLAAELGLISHLRDVIAADPGLANRRDERGGTLLTRACYWGQIESTRLLLDHGANPNLATADGFLDIRPLGAAVATPDTPNPSDDEEVVVALARLLLDRGADVNGRRKDGLTALHGAAFRGHMKVIRLLLDRGADPAIAGLPGGRHAGETAANMARSQGRSAAAKMLETAR